MSWQLLRSAERYCRDRFGMDSAVVDEAGRENIAPEFQRQPMTLKIQKSRRDYSAVVFRLSGRIEMIHVAELERLFDLEDSAVVLDLHDVQLIDRAAVTVLERWEANGVTLEGCPAYLREWIEKERTSL